MRGNACRVPGTASATRRARRGRGQVALHETARQSRYGDRSPGVTSVVGWARLFTWLAPARSMYRKVTVPSTCVKSQWLAMSTRRAPRCCCSPTATQRLALREGYRGSAKVWPPSPSMPGSVPVRSGCGRHTGRCPVRRLHADGHSGPRDRDHGRQRQGTVDLHRGRTRRPILDHVAVRRRVPRIADARRGRAVATADPATVEFTSYHPPSFDRFHKGVIERGFLRPIVLRQMRGVYAEWHSTGTTLCCFDWRAARRD